MSTTYRTVDTPVGTLTLVAEAGALRAVLWPGDDPARAGLDRRPALPEPAPHDTAARLLDAAERQFDAYFAGRSATFDLPLQPAGTPWQRQVWQALTGIPAGHTETYGALATSLGRPSAARAVGAAVGRNPLGVVVPCHRVVGADGTLTGFAGGVEAKRWLLQHEGALISRLRR